MEDNHDYWYKTSNIHTTHIYLKYYARGDTRVRAWGVLSTQWAPPTTTHPFSHKNYVCRKIILDNHCSIYVRRASYFRGKKLTGKTHAKSHHFIIFNIGSTNSFTLLTFFFFLTPFQNASFIVTVHTDSLPWENKHKTFYTQLFLCTVFCTTLDLQSTYWDTTMYQSADTSTVCQQCRAQYMNACGLILVVLVVTLLLCPLN